ncbi:TetR/AcrR family transcriptional regulator C-terminal ligand-binding domain-containing protein [Flexivirga oryzae]|uniref:AcrR family transcriptional regulator n=1 Tax=Flexivirga oryzae TaxID=1794944 RepID=A0A839N7A4_9MICO|nr:AcrR family transcriptional regulator [Flexivirga oryzae]
MSLSEKETPVRRRGAALEEAILDAAWEQLLDSGTSDFTYEAVAARAGTSRPVLYRRWPQREQLLKAAIRHGGTKVRRTIPDTGSLRDDMVRMLLDMNRTVVQFLALLGGHLAIMHSAERMTPEEIRNLYVAGRPQRMRVVIDRAIARGEVDPDRLSDLVLAVPADLVRQRIILTQRKVSRAYVEEIVDQVFLPLVSPLDGPR